MDTWTVSLPADLADFVKEQLSQKKWDNAESMFAAAISSLKCAQDVNCSMEDHSFRSQIQAGIEEIRRGELLEEHEVFDEVLDDLREPLQKSA